MKFKMPTCKRRGMHALSDPASIAMPASMHTCPIYTGFLEKRYGPSDMSDVGISPGAIVVLCRGKSVKSLEIRYVPDASSTKPASMLYGGESKGANGAARSMRKIKKIFPKKLNAGIKLYTLFVFMVLHNYNYIVACGIHFLKF